MTRELRSRRKRSALERSGCSTGFDFHAGAPVDMGGPSSSLFPSPRNREMTPGGTYVSLIMRSSGVVVVGACATGALLSPVLIPVQAVRCPPEIVYLSVSHRTPFFGQGSGYPESTTCF